MEYNSTLCRGDLFPTWLLNPTSSSLFPHFWAWGFLLGFFVVVPDRGSNYGFSQLQFFLEQCNAYRFIQTLLDFYTSYYKFYAWFGQLPKENHRSIFTSRFVKGNGRESLLTTHFNPFLKHYFSQKEIKLFLKCYQKKQVQFIPFYLLPVL